MFYTHTINSKFTTSHEYINSLLLAMSKFKEEKKLCRTDTAERTKSLCTLVRPKKKNLCV